MNNKMYTSSPLPFQGQKRNFIKDFKQALKKFDGNSVFVDLFGGSGLLSHTVKNVYPNAKVIYNDYDNFSKRLKNVKITNKLLSELRVITQGAAKLKRLSPERKKEILKTVKDFEKNYGYVDYITLSANVLFSAKYVTDFIGLENSAFYNKVRKSDYQTDGYLDGVEIVRNDYKYLYEEYKCRNVVFLLDPPYLSTDVSSYSGNYWSLKDYLDVLNLLDAEKYVYFTSNKSNIIELMNWFDNTTLTSNPFKYATTITRTNPVTHNAVYNDVMIFKNE